MGIVAFNVYTQSFEEGKTIPKRFTCDGENISPHVAWKDVPEGTESFVLVMSDPDAPVGTFFHWILYDIPANVREIPEGKSVGKQGLNDFGELGYGGPCPPKGHGKHRYYITVYALSSKLGISEGFDARRLLRLMKGKVLAKDSIMGIYERR